jgi:hypothetical protein
MAIDVIKEESDLQRERWTFSAITGYTDRVTLCLHAYAVEKRETKRHKWKPIDRWERNNERSYWSNLKREQVTIPDWVKQKARELVQIDVPDLEPTKEERW